MEKYKFRTIVLDKYVKGAVSVTSLSISKDGTLYGALANTNNPGHILFRYNPKTDIVKDCGLIIADKETPSLQKDRYDLKLGHHAMEFGYDSKLYGSTSSTYVTDDPNYKYDEVVGGHMIRFDPETGFATDLGLLIRHNFTMAATIDPKRKKFVGTVIPMNLLYVYDIIENTVSVKGQLRGPWIWYQIHDIACDDNGIVWGSYGQGRLFKYDTVEDTLTETLMRIPGDVGAIDTIIKGNDGMVYGGTWDGFFFSINPQTEKVINVGKPAREAWRIGGLAMSREGKVYGVVGGYAMSLSMEGKVYEIRLGNAHLFVFDPSKDKLEDLGFIQDREVGSFGGMNKICSTAHAMAIADDETLYIGETDRYPHLYIGTPVAGR